MDIYEYLKKDHKEVSALMAQVLKTKSPEKREQLFDTIADALTLHAETEQATFYAALESEDETEEKIEEAEEDHQELKAYIRKLSSLSADTEMWMELFGEFKHAVEHHVHDEEYRIFEKAKNVPSASEARQLAEDIAALKREATASAA